MSRKRLGESGFFIVLIMGGIGIVAVVTMLILHQFNTSKANQLQTNSVHQATSIINNLASFVKDHRVWMHTVWHASNTNLLCLKTPGDCTSQASNAPPLVGGLPSYPLSPPGGSFALHGLDIGPDGSTTIRAYPFTNTTQGFTLTGEPCNTYDDVNGNDKCPFHAVLYWDADCGATIPCNDYTVNGYLRYKPKTTSLFAHAFKSANYSFSVSKNASGNVYYCCSIGCTNASGDNGLAFVTLSIFDWRNCHAGSLEIENGICDRVITTSPFAYEWTPNGNNTPAYLPPPAAGPAKATCPQGPP